MKLFQDKFSIYKKAGEPLYKTPKSVQECIELQIKIQRQKRKEGMGMGMQGKEQSRSSRLVMRHPLFFLLPLGCAALGLLLHLCLKGRKSVLEGQMGKSSL